MKFLFLALGATFKGVIKILSSIRSLFFNLLFFGIIALIIFSLFRSREPVLPSNSLLTLTIAGNIVEQQHEGDPFSQFLNTVLGFPEKDRETLLQDILDAIDHAANDSKIKGILLDLESMGSVGLNQLVLIGDAINKFRESGKPVIAAEDHYSQNQYYLASHADKIFLNPMGGVYLNGFGLYRLYFQDALEKLKINYHVFRVGAFKSALEPLTRNSMSPEDRQQSRTWLTALWGNYVEDIAEQRSLTPEKINKYINNIPYNLEKVDGDISRLALDSGLVDELRPHHEIRDYLVAITGAGPHNNFRQISLNQYLKTVHLSYNYQGDEKDTVALIVAQGTIISGESKPGTIGSKTIAKLLREALETDHIKAVVLRIDSGGGSAFASEIIRQEILEFKRSQKPLIVSMGSLAASGAYWISADADEIWASPNTLTGSIGIFMAVPTFEKALNNFGVYRDGVGTTNLAPGLDLTQPLSIEVKTAIQLTLNHGYRTFLSIVAEGRNLSHDKVEQLAQGKVYAGADALEAGLIDKLGTLSQAISSAADHAGLDDYATVTLASAPSFKNFILRKISSEVLALFPRNSMVADFFTNILSANSEIRSLLLFNDPNGMYAHCMINFQ